MNLIPTTTPGVVKALFPSLIWNIPDKGEKVIYLTFDDGPTPEITEWTLDILKQYNAKATFFCIGNNINKYPDIFQKIIHEGHAIGNHTHDHVKGWRSPLKDYIANVERCEETLKSFDSHSNPSNIKSRKSKSVSLFRPPHGQITLRQIKKLHALNYKIVMWSVLSIDWDSRVTPKKCKKNVIDNVKPGSIVVFHDSKKAARNMQYALPKVLEHFSKKGYIFKCIPE